MNISRNKVLIVEDSKTINNLLISSLSEKLHIDVKSATSIKEAKNILKNHKDEFFVAILDLNLPDGNEGEIVDLVLDYGISPIILTASSSDNLHDEMMDKPIIDYVVKNSLNELEYVVDSVRRLRENMGKKVLVVDDSKSSRHLQSSLLQRLHLEVLEASNGKDALIILENQSDIVLMTVDYNMPEMNGLELCAEVRKQHPWHELAILGISTVGSGSTSIKLLKSGANDFMVRPFMHEEYFYRINQNINYVVSYNKLKEASDRDFLTGIYNRKYLFSTGEKLFENAKRQHITLMICMVDIDHFKKVNDTYGHHVGDKAIIHITTVFQNYLRSSDIITRIGGEEFCMLCVNIDETLSERLLEKIRKKIQDTPLVYEDLIVPITVSMGYTLVLGGSLEQMMKNADTAMYESKNNGRNQITLYENFKE